MPFRKRTKSAEPRPWVFLKMNFSIPEDVAFYFREIAKHKPKGWQSEVVVNAMRAEIEKAKQERAD